MVVIEARSRPSLPPWPGSRPIPNTTSARRSGVCRQPRASRHSRFVMSPPNPRGESRDGGRCGHLMGGRPMPAQPPGRANGRRRSTRPRPTSPTWQVRPAQTSIKSMPAGGKQRCSVPVSVADTVTREFGGGHHGAARRRRPRHRDDDGRPTPGGTEESAASWVSSPMRYVPTCCRRNKVAQVASMSARGQGGLRRRRGQRRGGAGARRCRDRHGRGRLRAWRFRQPTSRSCRRT